MGLSLRHDVQVGSAKGATLRNDARAIVNGVTAGTVTALAIDRSIMQSASRVALAQLDVANGSVTGSARGPVRGERFAASGWNELVKAGLLQRIERSNLDVERRFTGTPGAGRDAVGMLQPQGVAIDAWFGLASLPQVGRNLLDSATWPRVSGLRDSGELVLLVFENGRLTMDRAGGAAARPARLRALLHQGDRTLELREVDIPPGVRLTPPRPVGGEVAPARLWRSVGARPLDAAQALSRELQVLRDSGGEAPQRAEASFTQAYSVADLKSWLPAPAPSAWALLKQASASRVMELAVLGLGLALLVVLLLRQRWVAANTGRLKWVRAAYLLFTLVFIGWVAQGQLTIVTLTSLIEALVAGQGLAFLLADPVTVLLWAFVVWALGCTLLSLFVFRGYCRYVCPLGAALSLFGRLRLFAWIPRRTECGTPCQSCRRRCEYQAIAPSGVVDYAECFQCLDCVEIYQDDRRCLPLVVERKQSGARHIRIQPVALS